MVAVTMADDEIDDYGIEVIELKAAQAWQAARSDEALTGARKVARAGGNRSVGQLRTVWMSGYMTGSYEFLSLVGQVTETGGPDHVALMLLARTVMSGDFELARSMAQPFVELVPDPRSTN